MSMVVFTNIVLVILAADCPPSVPARFSQLDCCLVAHGSWYKRRRSFQCCDKVEGAINAVAESTIPTLERAFHSCNSRCLLKSPLLFWYGGFHDYARQGRDNLILSMAKLT
jgi:hypothetical protein